MKKLLSLSLITASALALEFGSMSSISNSMGFAGVALKNNDFAMQYNPALLAYSNTRFAYNLGLEISSKNLLELTSVDKNTADKISNTLDNLHNTFSEKKSSIMAEIETEGTAAGFGKYGNFTPAIQDFIDRNKNSLDADLANLAASIDNDKMTTTVEELQNKMKSDPILGEKIKNELKTSITNTQSDLTGNGVDTTLITNTIDSVSSEGLLSILDKANKGELSDPSVIAAAAGEINLSKIIDTDSNDDINTILNTIEENEVNVKFETGFEMNKPVEDDDALSGIGFGLMTKFASSASMYLNPNKNRLIINIKNSDNTMSYYELRRKGSEIFVSTVTQAEFESQSALSKTTDNTLYARALMMMEIPVGYAQANEFDFGDISVGANLKYIYAMGYGLDKKIHFDIDGMNSDELKFNDDLKNPKKTHTFGIDLGALYSYEDFSAGLVLKNLNSPKIKLNNGDKVKLNTQIRAGLAYQYKFATFAFDMDLAPNDTLSLHTPKSQMLGGGVKLDFTKWFNIRAGLAKDIKKDEGLIYTAGFNLFKAVDFSFAASNKKNKLETDDKNYNLPKFFDVKLSFGYNW